MKQPVLPTQEYPDPRTSGTLFNTTPHQRHQFGKHNTAAGVINYELACSKLQWLFLDASVRSIKAEHRDQTSPCLSSRQCTESWCDLITRPRTYNYSGPWTEIVERQLNAFGVEFQ